MSDGTIRAIWIVKLPSMPKLYLGPGLSQRVHRALSQRLERFMANAALPAAPEFPLSENPPLSAQRDLLIRNQRKEKSMVSLTLKKATNHRQTKRKRMKTDQGLPDQGSLNQTLTTRQAFWLPPQPWPSGSRR